MRKTFVIFALALLLFSVSFVAASGDHDEMFEQAEEIINQKISCDELTNDQLEVLGEYYMEQMHPGELHEVMDERMGGEGSESLRQAHINMGRAFYCGEHGAMSGGMMDMMMGRGMMGGSSNMMGNAYYGGGMAGFSTLGWIVTLLVIVVLILLIIWLFQKLQSPESKYERRHKRK